MCLFAFIIVMGDVWRKICCFPTWFKMYYFSGQRRRSIEGVGGVCHFFCVVPSSSCCSPQFNGRFTLLYSGSLCFTLVHFASLPLQFLCSRTWEAFGANINCVRLLAVLCCSLSSIETVRLPQVWTVFCDSFDNLSPLSCFSRNMETFRSLYCVPD